MARREGETAVATFGESAFTDAPPLHPNLLVGSLHLLFWLFVHPAAWRAHVARVDPDLQPDFSLTILTRAQWRLPALRRLLLQVYLIWLPLLVLPLGVVLWLAGVSSAYVAFALVFATLFGMVINVAVGTAVSVAYGYAGGVVMALVGGLVSGLLVNDVGGIPSLIGGPFGLLETSVPEVLLGMSLGLLIPAVALGATYGAASRVGLGLAQRAPGTTSPAQWVGVLVGTLVGGLLYGVASTVPLQTIAALTPYETAVVISGLIFGLTSSLTLGWHTARWRRSLTFGLLFCVAIILSGTFATRQIAREVAFALSCGLFGCFGYAHIYYAAVSVIFVTVIVSSTAPFALAVILGQRIAGRRAGAAAGLFGVTAATVALLSTFDPSSPYCRYPSVCLSPTFSTIVISVLLFTVVPALLLFTAAWWRPLLLYPLSLLWNFTLYRLDVQRWRRQQRRDHSLLRRHTAFWDAHQWLPLVGLDEYLIWVAEHFPQEVPPALAYLSAGRQRWAVQAAEVELDARRLQRYTHNVAAIAEAHRHLVPGELTGPASVLTRSFRRHSQDVEAALNQATAYHKRLALRGVEDRLNNLLRELMRSHAPYAARFYPIAAGWHQTVVNYRHVLAETAELQQEIDNPYIFGVPLTEAQEIFVGRRDVSTRIEQLLLDARRPPLLLYGQRRMGKTSLLRNLGRLLPSTIVPLFVDGEGLAGAGSYADFLHHVSWQMRQSAQQQRGVALPPLSREQIADTPFTRFVEWLSAVEEMLAQQGQRMGLLALDEFEAVDTVLDKGRFDGSDVMRTLRHIIQHHPRFKLLLAGSHTLAEFRRWASYLINVQVIKIGYLEEDETRQLVERPVADFPLTYQPEACRRVLDLTRGHPHLVQLLCYEIVALKNEQAPAVRRLATVEDVETAVARALATGAFFFADIEQNQVDAAGLALLRQIAAQGAAGLAVTEVAAEAQTVAALRQRDLIMVENGRYCFQVELIRRWFAQ